MRIGRLTERRAFERLTRDGLHARTESLWCRYLPASGNEPPRVAFAIGRSVGTSAARNRLRRRLRAALQSFAGSPLLPSGELLVGAKPAAVERTFAELRDEVASLLGSVVGVRDREVVR